MGYSRAGFEVVGVDIDPQPHYPFEFVEMNALRYGAHVEAIQRSFDAIHASPPCQFYASLSKGEHWRSIPPTRELLEQIGLPFVIENIQDACWDMHEPARLCGSMFGLNVRRHRMFETSFPLMVPSCSHENHGRRIRAYYGKKGWLVWTPAAANVQRRGRTPLLRGSVEDADEDMGIDWMTWDELREAIPPVYTEMVGHQLMQHIRAGAVA
jgi:DNA (cytosine-5)-methyltransferase 1